MIELCIGICIGIAGTSIACLKRTDREHATLTESRDRWQRYFHEECYRHAATLREHDALHRELETLKRTNLARMTEAA